MIVKRAERTGVKMSIIFISYFCCAAVYLQAMENSGAFPPLPSLKAPVHARSPLRSAVIAGNEPLVRKLLSTGAAEVDEVDAEQRTALHVMLAGSDTPRTQRMVRVLLEHKASVDRADCYGIMPLDYAHLQSFAIHTLLFDWVERQSREQAPDQLL